MKAVHTAWKQASVGFSLLGITSLAASVDPLVLGISTEEE
jgi:hypothetical protein